MSALLDGFIWLTGEWFTSLLAAVALALIGGILLGWLDWFVERVSMSQGDDWKDEGNAKPTWRVW